MARSREARKSRRIRALRIVLLIVLVATIGGLVAFLVRERLQREPPARPPAVGPEDMEATGETVTVGEGFERTVSEGDRSLFTVRGERYSVTRDGVVHLEGVGITVYDDGGKAYDITSPEAWFRPDRREAQLTGGVELNGPNGIRMVTDDLRVTQRGRIITSRGQIYVRFGNRFHARADRLRVELHTQRFRLVGHVLIRSLEESPAPFEMKTRLLTFDRSRHIIEGDDGPVWIYHQQDWLSAIHVFVFLDEDETRVQYIRARDRVVAELRSPEALGRVIEPIDVPGGMSVADGEEVARSPDAEPAGEAEEDGVERPAPAAGEALGPASAPEEEQRLGRIVVRADRLEIEITPDGKQAKAIHLEGSPEKPAALRSFVIHEGPVRRLLAPRIDGTFVDGRPAEFVAQDRVGLVELDRASGTVVEEVEAELHGPAEEEEGPKNTRVARRANSRRAEASFDAQGELTAVTLIDRVVIVDAGVPGESGSTRASGDRAIFHLDQGSMELTGVPATVVSPSGTMEAPVLVYTRADGILHGTGQVRARLDDAGRSALGGTPLGEGEGPVWVEAEQGFLRNAPRGFLFAGSVRAWRGSDLLTADKLLGDDTAQRLTATGDVRSLWIPEEDDGAAADGPLEVTAKEMVFERGEGVLVYTGDVVSKQQERIVRCQEMDLFLRSDEPPPGMEGEAADGGAFEKLICTGEVEVTDPASESGGGRTLTGHRAVYLPGARTIEVDSTPEGKVTMKDRDGNVLEGPRMIYEIDQDRVRVLPRTEETPPVKADAEEGS